MQAETLHNGTTAMPPGTLEDWGRLACASRGRANKPRSQERSVMAARECMVLSCVELSWSAANKSTVFMPHVLGLYLGTGPVSSNKLGFVHVVRAVRDWPESVSAKKAI